ncbi:MAG: shikimate dehydrogenase [Rubrobacteraceae bacterium]|jgi:shikimate dehydrogenase|nr:shikimate dehydrogenase [Rubrobacteraceae bacterium]
MHNAAFAVDKGMDPNGVDYVYVAMNVWPDHLAAAVGGLAALGFIGFNVTMPHKEPILPLMDELDDTARLAGAVNTVVAEEGRLRGLNTDGSGFVEACQEAGVSFSGRRVLILGAGGAAAAIAVASLGEGASRLYIANRTAGRAEELRAKLSMAVPGAEILVCPFDQAGDVAVEAEILINATYLGMKKGDPLPFPAETLTAEKIMCDAVYLAGEETALVRRAREAGACTVSGERMLLYQGVQAQRIWTGKEPNVVAMSGALA